MVEVLRIYSSFEPTVDLATLTDVLARHRRPESDVVLTVAEPVRLTEELRASIVAMYGEGKFAREIAADLGISKTRILKVLHQTGVVMRPRGPSQRRV